jgi:acetyl esterase/lipase
MGILPRPIELINKSVGLAGVSVKRGLAYGSHPRQRLDVYGPKRLAENLPVIVFFYGGSWQGGERADYAFIASLLVRQGFIVVVPDYRLYPEVKFPDFVEDSAAAVAWAFNNIAAAGGDTESIFLLGHSAGAYNAVLLGLAGIFLQESGASAGRLAGVIGLAGPYDFLPLKDPALKIIFSTPVDIRHTQPITFARGDAPPMFLATGGADTVVMPRNTAALAARLRELGGTVETRIYPGIGHIGLILATLPYLGWRAPVLKDLLAFCEACRAGEFSAHRSEIPSRMVG